LPAINIAVTLITLGAILAAALNAFGLGAAGDALRAAYSLVCPQRPTHSYFLLGHQVALEQRNLAMLVAVLIGGLVYAIRRDRLTALGWVPLTLLAVPITWDVLSQTVGLRDSDWFTRSWTGALFSLGFAAFAYPRIDRLFALTEPGRLPG